jgi:hypothetical protein
MEDPARMQRAPEPLAPAALELAARALAGGDALRALSLVGRTPGALGLALRGIAYAQLGDLVLARGALEQAGSTTDDARLLARVRAALVEVALGEGDPARAAGAARASADELARLGDARNAVSSPVARLERGGATRDADLFAIEDAARGELFLVDACRRLAIAGRARVPFARRPVLFTLLLELARAAPAPVPRDVLAARAFDARRINASHRGRLRVEIGRLRKLLDGLGAEPVATAAGYALASRREVAIVTPRTEDDATRVAILLGDGASWSAQRIAESAGISKRTAQRALGEVVTGGRAVRTGSGRNVRYQRPGTPIASRMLLLGLAPSVRQDEEGDPP